MDDRSILLRLEEAGRPAPRLQLRPPAPETPSPPAPTAPGAERYALIGEIARGGVGVVHRARDTDLGRDVALKVLRDEFVENPEIVHRFVEEAQIGGQLQHPGIVPVLELGVREGRQPFFAMKLVKGETLAAALAARPDVGANRRRLLGIFAQACQTVAYAHARGVIHRDLKPSNIMIGGFGEVQVVDWGFAKVLRKGGVDDERQARRDTTVIATVRSAAEGSASVAGSVMGTPAYMPPEQALGHVEDLDARADVFALGAILCEILTGKPPYTGDAQERLMAASQCRLEDAHARLARCGAGGELVALSRHAMSPLPKDRPATARELADALDRYLAATERRAHEARLLAARRKAEMERQRRSRRFTLAVAAGILGLVVLGFGGYQWLAHEGAQRERRRAAAVEGALQEAGRLGGAGDFVAAIAAAERARDLGGGADAEAALLRAKEAKAAADEETARRMADEAFLAELEELRLERADYADARKADASFLAAFSRRGFDLSRPEAIAKRLGASHLAAEFASFFDAWSCVRAEYRGDAAALEDLARRIDPVSAHATLVDALRSRDVASLRALAEGPEAIPRAIIPAVGDRLLRLGDRKAAVMFLRRARDRYPDDFWIQYQLAMTSWSDRTRRFLDPGRAVLALSACCALRPACARARGALGMALSDLGDHASAIATYRSAIRIDPTLAGFHGNLTRELCFAGDPEAAVVEGREAVRLKPDNSYYRANLAIAYLHSGNIDGAIVEGREAIRLDPKLAPAQQVVAEALERKGDVDGAIQAMRQAVRLDPADPQLHAGLGRLLLDDVEDIEGAITEYQEAIRLAPRAPRTRSGLANAYLRRGDPVQAILVAREAIRINPDDAPAYLSLGYAFHQKCDWKGAIEALNEALRLDPRSQASEFLPLVRRMLALDPRLERVLRGEENPVDATEQMEFATLCYQRSRYVEGARLAMGALARDPRLARDHGYEAAFIAVLGAAATANPREASAFRAAALGWLRTDLAAWDRALGKDPLSTKRTLAHWRHDRDLASVRDRINELPEPEREGWRKLWADVDARVAGARR